MHAIILLADSAQAVDGKLYILGGGWSLAGPGPTPCAVAIKLTLDTLEFDQDHHWELFLEDADGQPVRLDTLEGPQPLEVRGELRASAPPDMPAGTPIDIPIAINFGPLPLLPAKRYMWRLTVNGDTPEGGTVAFSTRPALAPTE
jgi:hypothetical protein